MYGPAQDSRPGARPPYDSRVELWRIPAKSPDGRLARPDDRRPDRRERAGRRARGTRRRPNASSAYLLAVLVSAMSFGTTAGIVAAFGGFLLYDFLFIEPLYTLHGQRPRRVAQPDPAPRRRDRRRPARGGPAGPGGGGRRARAGGRALFRVSRALATRASTIAVLPGDRFDPADRGRPRAGLGGADPRGGPERVVADTGGGAARCRPPAMPCCAGCPATRPPSGSASTSRELVAVASPACLPTG